MVVLNMVRKAAEISWMAEEIPGNFVDIKATNVETGDVSTRDKLPNDGVAVLTFPMEYSGETRVEVSSGSHKVEGVIEV